MERSSWICLWYYHLGNVKLLCDNIYTLFFCYYRFTFSTLCHSSTAWLNLVLTFSCSGSFSSSCWKTTLRESLSGLNWKASTVTELFSVISKNEIFKASIFDQNKIIYLLFNIALLIYLKSFTGCYDQNVVFSIRSGPC